MLCDTGVGVLSEFVSRANLLLRTVWFKLPTLPNFSQCFNPLSVFSQNADVLQRCLCWRNRLLPRCPHWHEKDPTHLPCVGCGVLQS